MTCVSCAGDGCDDCNKVGSINITCCPLDMITADVWEIIQMADFYQKGLPPVAGGVLDQAKNFNDAAMFVFKEKAYWKNKLGLFD